MYFQVLDSKAGCYGVYVDGKIYDIREVPQNLSKTWSYSRQLDSLAVECASIYTAGKNIEQSCPEFFVEDWKKISKKMKAFLKSFITSGVSLQDHCFYDLVPDRFLLEYNLAKTIITKHIFETVERPVNYDFLHAIVAATDKIAGRDLNIDEKELQKHFSNPSSRRIYKAVKNGKRRAVYNVFGSITGRLSTYSSSFPILNLDKRLRGCLKPTNDLFLELDFNSAEIRVLLSLSGVEQPEEDIHIWNGKNIFATQKFSREESKKAFFSWLYNPNAEHKSAEKVYNRSKVKELYYKDGVVTNPFKRSFDSDEFRGLNHIVQSTTSDLLLFQMLRLDRMLEGKKSFISFTLHDSIVIDLDREEKDLIFALVDEFKKTPLGNFKANVALGDNFGNMRKVDV